MDKLTAGEIKRQASRVSVEADNFQSNCSAVIKRLDRMSNIVNSVDSDLSRRINQYQNAYIDLYSRLTGKFKNLSSIMNKYADKTLSNEQEMANIAKEAAGNIENIASNNDAPEIFTDFN